jgi:putative PIN family toxin of toxin-antitoxin system
LRVLLDTNIFISAILFGGLPRELMVLGLRGEIELVTSPALLNELTALLEEEFAFSPAAADETRRELELVAEVVEPREIPDVCRDPDDNHVLAAANTGGAELFVTGDRDLLVLKAFEDIEIVEPAQALQKLAAKAS